MTKKERSDTGLFDSLVNNPQYRTAALEQQRLGELLTQTAKLQSYYHALKNEYGDRANDAAKAVEQLESSLQISPQQASYLLPEWQERLDAVAATLDRIQSDLDRLKIRRTLGELDKAVFVERKNLLRDERDEQRIEQTYIEHVIALIVRNEVVEEPTPGESAADPADDAKISPETEEAAPATDFSTNQTLKIPPELVGSDPDRLLEPALHIQVDDGWERFPLRGTEVSIGNISNPENDIALYDTQVSRRHAKVIYDSVTSSWYLVDLNSTNGSSVNDLTVEAQNPAKLSPNDTLTLGNTKIMVYLP